MALADYEPSNHICFDYFALPQAFPGRQNQSRLSLHSPHPSSPLPSDATQIKYHETLWDHYPS